MKLFDIGSKFTVGVGKNPEYTITSIGEQHVKVEWYDENKKYKLKWPGNRSIEYKISEATYYFNNNIWVLDMKNERKIKLNKLRNSW